MPAPKALPTNTGTCKTTFSCPSGCLRQRALQALCVSDPAEKSQQTLSLWQAFESAGLVLDTARTLEPEPLLKPPGRPERPELVPPMRVPQRSPFVPEGLAALVHAVCHIEFNAINLALDAVWRFPDMPRDFYGDWLCVAAEEAAHFGLLQALLKDMGFEYGDFPAHDGLWEMCIKTQSDATARMALVPRTLEARGLDATPLIQARLRKVNSPDAHRAIAILDVILQDEIGHVAVGNRWYRWLCEREGLEPVSHYRTLARLYNAPRLRPPFNEAARRLAGFSQRELDMLAEVHDV